MKVTVQNQNKLLAHARLVIENYLHATEYNYLVPTSTILGKKHGIFLTIFVDDKLRGSLGYVDSDQCIMESVTELAKALCDGSDKYLKLEKFELPYLRIQINIFSALHQIYNKEEIEIGKHGLYVNHPEGEGLLFPQRAVEMDYDEVIFLNEVCHKAGLPSFTWEDDECKVYTFETIVFSDKETH